LAEIEKYIYSNIYIKTTQWQKEKVEVQRL